MSLIKIAQMNNFMERLVADMRELAEETPWEDVPTDHGLCCWLSLFSDYLDEYMDSQALTLTNLKAFPGWSGSVTYPVDNYNEYDGPYEDVRRLLNLNDWDDTQEGKDYVREQHWNNEKRREYVLWVAEFLENSWAELTTQQKKGLLKKEFDTYYYF